MPFVVTERKAVDVDYTNAGPDDLLEVRVADGQTYYVSGVLGNWQLDRKLVADGFSMQLNKVAEQATSYAYDVLEWSNCSVDEARREISLPLQSAPDYGKLLAGKYECYGENWLEPGWRIDSPIIGIWATTRETVRASRVG